MPATRTSASPDRVGRRPARQLARQLGALTGRRRAVVLLADPSTGGELARHVEGPPPGAIDGDAVLALVLPSQPTVCDAARLHEPALRRLAHDWRADRLLVAPCTFGHNLVAVAVVAVPRHAEPLPIERAARPIAERFAAAVIGTRLFSAATSGDSLVLSIGA